MRHSTRKGEGDTQDEDALDGLPSDKEDNAEFDPKTTMKSRATSSLCWNCAWNWNRNKERELEQELRLEVELEQ